MQPARLARAAVLAVALTPVARVGLVAQKAGSAGKPAAARVAAADLVLKNGHVVTVDEKQPEAQALAVRGDRIVAVGSDADVVKLVGPRTRVIDLHGRLAIPGFIEGHGHFLGVGEAHVVIDAMNVRSFEEIAARVKAAAARARPGEWILGRGWHQEKWDRTPQPNVEGVPLHQALDDVAPNNPVILTHASGHASFVNGKALALAGITKATPNPPGGEIVHDPRTGEPTGLLRESAQGLVERAYDRARSSMTAAQQEAEGRRLIELAGAESLQKGVTTFHDAGNPFRVIDLYHKMAAEGTLPVRVYAMVRGESLATLAAKLPAYRTIGFGHGFLTVRAIKRVADGALGSHGAWMLEPYTDMPGATGLVEDSPSVILKTAELAIRYGYQLNTHAIGDRANRETLDVYEKAFQAHPEIRSADLRWRVEHAQNIAPSDLPRFAKLGVVASMQAIHCTSDGPWVPKRIGDERARTEAYMWRSLLDSGAVVTNGTDAPVEDMDPIPNFYAAVTRKMKNGQYFYPEQKMTRAEALKAYTLANAWDAFEENEKGTLTRGKLADITVLSVDIMTVPVEQIPTAKVDYTILGGKVKYTRATTTAAARR
ncbi:MAG TPA: amidohydrolase [Longimicrobiales bacterium]